MAENHSVSIAALIENRLEYDRGFLAGGLIMVEKKGSGLLGFIAGHLEKEDALSGILRELNEEANLKPENVILNKKPEVFVLPNVKKTSVGLAFRGETTKPINMSGYEPKSDEIALVKPYAVNELLDLIHEPEKLYKPDFNLAFLCYMILQYIGTKYAYDSFGFQSAIAINWGIPVKFIESYL